MLKLIDEYDDDSLDVVSLILFIFCEIEQQSFTRWNCVDDSVYA